jgi:hypothetical protein
MKGFSRMYISNKKHLNGRRWLGDMIANKRRSATICCFETLAFGKFLYFFHFFVTYIHVTNLFFISPFGKILPQKKCWWGFQTQH